MNIDTGEILPEEVIGRRYTLSQQYAHEGSTSRWRPMVVPPTQKQLARRRVGRNDTCPCGSGKKFKKCCFRKQVSA